MASETSGIKYRRNYKLLVAESTLKPENIDLAKLGPGKTITFEMPLTIDIDITRNLLQSTNNSTLVIYNAAKDKRDKVYKDGYTNLEYRAIELRAGYGDVLSTVFKGNINTSMSVRDGTNWKTTITCYDGGYSIANANISKSFPAGTPKNAVLKDMLTAFGPTVTVGAIGSYTGTISRGNALAGNASQLATELSGGALFVDLEKAYLLRDSECIRGPIEVINASSGLLNTPRREHALIYVEMLFEPRLIIGQLVKLESLGNIELKNNSVTPNSLNGYYKVISLSHKGTISPAVSGSMITIVGLLNNFSPSSVIN